MGKLTKLFIGCTAIGIAAATAYYFMARNAESEIPAADIDEEAPEVEAKTEEKDNFIDKATRTYTTVVSFIADSAEKVMDYLDRDEEERVIKLSQGEPLPYDAGKTWLDHFLLNVRSNPDKTAVTDNLGSFTYSELDKASDAAFVYVA